MISNGNSIRTASASDSEVGPAMSVDDCDAYRSVKVIMCRPLGGVLLLDQQSPRDTLIRHPTTVLCVLLGGDRTACMKSDMATKVCSIRNLLVLVQTWL